MTIKKWLKNSWHNFLVTPFHALIPLYSIYAGCVGLAYNIPNPYVPLILTKVIDVAIIIGGIIVTLARASEDDAIYYERAGLTLMAVSFAFFGAFYLSRAGVSFLTVGAVMANYIVAIGFMVRIHSLGQLAKTKQKLSRGGHDGLA